MKKALIISTIVFVVSIIAFAISVAATGLREGNFAVAIGLEKIFNGEHEIINDDTSEMVQHHFDTIEEVNDIEINVLSADTIVEVADVEAITIDYTGDTGNTLDTYVEGDKLVVEESENFLITFISWDFNSSDANLKITLPSKEYDDVTINAASGTIDIHNLTAKRFDANSASGDMNYNIYAEDIKISTLSGNVEVTNCTDLKAKKLKMTSTSGDHSVSGFATEEFTFESMSGTISADGISGRGAVNITSGEIELTYSQWDNELDINAVSGSVDVTLPDNSGVVVQLSAVSGGVDVDLTGSDGEGTASAMLSGDSNSGLIGGSNSHKVSVNLVSGDVDIHN